MNPVTSIVLGFFALVLIGFPVLMAALGMPTRDNVLVMIFVAVTAIAVTGFMVWLGRRYAGDFERLVAGEYWVHWQIDPLQRERFVAEERTRSKRDASLFLRYSLIVAIVGAAIMWGYTETLQGAAIGFGVLCAAGVLVVVTTRIWGGARPRREAQNLDDIYLGALGIYQLGRYTPLRGMNIFLTDVDYVVDDAPILRFAIGSRTQHGVVVRNDVRVMVPVGQESEAQEIVGRFRREFDLKDQ